TQVGCPRCPRPPTAARAPGMARRASLVLPLAGALRSVPPLGAANPPDPTWIGVGFFDDADHDDVVLAITSAVSVIESGVAHAVEPVAVCLGLIKLAGPKPLPAGPLESVSTRAPPQHPS